MIYTVKDLRNAVAHNNIIISSRVVYYGYELRWSSSDNALKESDASGSFFFCLFFTGSLSLNLHFPTQQKEPRQRCLSSFSDDHYSYIG